MALTQMAETVRQMKADEAVRDAVANGDAKALEAFSEEERQALVDLARRMTAGAGLPEHQQRSKDVLNWA